MKKLFDICGVQKKHCVFMFSDTQIAQEGFLEDVNNMLSSGEVPNMYAPEDLPPIRDAVRADAKAAGYPETNEGMYAFFIEQARRAAAHACTRARVHDRRQHAHTRAQCAHRRGGTCTSSS
jgi:hypothetical protein